MPLMGGLHVFFAGLLNLLVLVINLLIAFWVYRDSSRRYPPGSLAPLIWGIAALIGGLLVVILYLLVRPPERR